MKYLITENKLNDVVKSMVSKQGLDYTIKFFGGDIGKVVDAYNGDPYEYLNSFSNLRKVVGSRKEVYMITENNRIIIRFTNKLLKRYPHFSVSYVDFLRFFSEGIGMTGNDYNPIIMKWFNETYNYNMTNVSQFYRAPHKQHLDQ
jgi:hypothetical protein